MALSQEDVNEILQIIDAVGAGEVRLETEGFVLHVAIGENASLTRPGAAVAPAAPVAQPAAAVAAVPPPVAAPVSAPAAGPPEAAEPEASAPGSAEAEAPRGEPIESPMLGTFYRAEAPGAAPFVEVGTVVEEDSVVCIIEVMKMMNSVVAGVSGRIVEVCADNGVLVEYGEPLFRVEPV